MAEPHELAPIKIAFIIDNVVVDLMNTDDRWGAIFLSDPTTVDVTDRVAAGLPIVGTIYDEETKSFIIPPEDNQE